MRDLVKWQVVSFTSRMLAMALGLVQTFVIIRILSVGEWGLVQLAVSIGGALGIYQHLGLASASTREISSAKDKKQITKIFVTSAFVRYCVTLPLAVGLFFLSKHIALNLYKNSDLIFPLRVYAVSLIFQGIQSILNSVISGTKRFKELFIYQVAIAGVSVGLYIPLVYFFKVSGFFYAFLAFNIISSIALSVVAFRPFKGKFVFPNRKEFIVLLKEIFSISIAIYVVKIIYTNWEKLGSNFLGLSNSPEVVAIYAFALLYAKKLMNISDSVTAVNLPVLSEKYSKDIKEFRMTFSENFNKVFSLIVFIGAFASYFAPIAIRVLVGSDKYDASLPLIAPMVLAFMMYSFINIFNSSVMIPAKLSKSMVLSYGLLIIGSGAFFGVTFKFMELLPAVAWGMAFGGIVSFFAMNMIIKKKLMSVFFHTDHTMVLIQAFSIAWLCVVENVVVKGFAFVPFAFLLGWSFFISGFIKKSDVLYIRSKIKLSRKK
ncbi:oligosaccharide flippase family protein [Patescibacteria group bacterium]